jgi:hypothetical protein
MAGCGAWNNLKAAGDSETRRSGSWRLADATRRPRGPALRLAPGPTSRLGRVAPGLLDTADSELSESDSSDGVRRSLT